MNFFKGVLNVVLGKYSSQIFEIISSILIVRALGSNDYGIYVIVYIIPNLIVSFGSFGLGPAIIYFYNSKVKSKKKIVVSFTLISLLLGIFFMIFMLLFKDLILIDYFKGKVLETYFYISILFIPFLFLRKFFLVMLQAFYEMKKYSFFNFLLPSVIRFSLIVVFLYLFKMGLIGGILIPLGVNIVISLLLFIYLFFLLKKKGEYDSPFISFNCLKEIFLFGIKNHIGSIIQKTNDQIAKLLLVVFVPPSHIGFFNIALRFSNIISSFTASITTVLVPKFAKTDKSRIKDLFTKISKYSFYSLTLFGFMIGIISPYVIEFFYGKEFLISSELLWLLIPGIPFIAIARFSNASFTQTGKPFVKSIIRGTGLIVNVLILLIFLSRFKIYAASISISLSYFFMFITAIILMKKEFDINIGDIFILTKNDIYYIIKFIKERMK